MDVGTDLASPLGIQSFPECRVSRVMLLFKSTAPYFPIQMAGSVYPHTLLPLDSPSHFVHSMGNTTRKEWKTCIARREDLQATPCWSILRSCLPRVVELQRTTVFHYSLVRSPSLSAITLPY